MHDSLKKTVQARSGLLGNSASKPLRVCHLILSMEHGGAERVVLDLARGGKQRGQEVSVWCIEREGDLVNLLRDEGIKVTCLAKQPGLRLGLMRAMHRELTRLRPDVIHAHQIGCLFYVGPAAVLTRVPAVFYTEHGTEYDGAVRTQWLARMAGLCADRFVGVSRQTTQMLTSHRIVPREKLEVVCNGINVDLLSQRHDSSGLRAELGIPQGCPVLGTVGRLADVKCQHLVLRALARIRQEPDLANAHAVLVGDGPERESLTRLAQELGLAEVVHLTGFQEQREKYYQLMDVFLLTSRSEAMPLVVLEAWAAGVPVIATAVGGIPEMIAHETTGVVVPVGDIEAIVTATLRLLRNREEARTMVAAASAEVHSRYSVQTMVEEYQRKYWNVIESKAGAAVR